MLFASLGLILSLARAAPAFEITGWVSAPAGARVTVEARPLPGLHEASLRAYGAGSGPALSRTETVDGERFRLRVDGPGIWLVVVRATDAVPMEVLVAPLVGDLELPPVTLEADEGSRLDLEVGRHPKSRAAAEPPLVQARVVADARLQHLRWRPHRPPRLSTDGALRFPRRRGESLER